MCSTACPVIPTLIKHSVTIKAVGNSYMPVAPSELMHPGSTHMVTASGSWLHKFSHDHDQHKEPLVTTRNFSYINTLIEHTELDANGNLVIGEKVLPCSLYTVYMRSYCKEHV